jgi:hypothetical protein
MATKKKNTNVTKLAKKGTTKNSKSQSNEENEKDVDAKAKERVQNLLNDVNLTANNENVDTLELNEENVQNLEWLQEQIKNLSEENEKLKKEADEAKENYKKIYSEFKDSQNKNNDNELIPDSTIKNGAIDLFKEVQKNYLGQNPEKVRYTEIKLNHLLSKMIKAFPFLKELKQF